MKNVIHVNGWTLRKTLHRSYKKPGTMVHIIRIFKGTYNDVFPEDCEYAYIYEGELMITCPDDEDWNDQVRGPLEHPGMEHCIPLQVLVSGMQMLTDSNVKASL